MLKRGQIPNIITGFRLVLAFAQFALFSVYLKVRVSGGGLAGPAHYVETAWGTFFKNYETSIFNVLFLLLFLAGISDALDGMLARRWNVVTKFGRIADPFADKIMISGSFVLFLPLGEEVVPVAAWMVVLMLAREYLVTSIRGYAESIGVAFPASNWGKAKMVLQSVCVGCLLLFLGHEGTFNPWAAPFLRVLVWVTVTATVISGVVYIQQARSILRTDVGDVESQTHDGQQDVSAAGPSASAG